MDITLVSFLVVCPLVFLAGFVDSIAGGGGLISLPAYMAAGVPPHYALGCNKISSSMGTMISTIRYIKSGAVDFKIVPASIGFALVGSAIGANLALLVSEDFLKAFLIFVLPVVAFLMLRKKETKKVDEEIEQEINEEVEEEKSQLKINRKKQIVVALIGAFIIGGYDGFYGPGTGTFLVLILTGLAKMDIKVASGNTKIINLSSNIAALITFIINGKVLFLLAMVAGIFGIVGNYIGSGLVISRGAKVVKPVMLLVLCLLFIKIVTE